MLAPSCGEIHLDRVPRRVVVLDRDVEADCPVRHHVRLAPPAESEAFVRFGESFLEVNNEIGRGMDIWDLRRNGFQRRPKKSGKAQKRRSNIECWSNFTCCKKVIDTGRSRQQVLQLRWAFNNYSAATRLHYWCKSNELHRVAEALFGI